MNNINTATKKLAMKEFINPKSKRDLKLYKNEKRKVKSLLVNILEP